MSIRIKPLVAASATTALLFTLVFAVLPREATASEAHHGARMSVQRAASSAASCSSRASPVAASGA